MRLYDPQRLRSAPRTSAPGVLVAQTPCGPFVQSIEWVDSWNDGQGAILLVQNITPGLGWRLTAGTINTEGHITWDAPIDLEPEDELEGLAVFPDDIARGVAVSASREDNARAMRLVWE